MSYCPLDASLKEIRCLRISGGEDGLVECEVVVLSLADDRIAPYEAISWCWGSSQETSRVRVDGCLLTVRRSAEQVLRWVLHRSDRRQLIWLDAVSINQEDLAERGQQVAIMGEIYTCAEQVAIHFDNEADETVKSALRSLRSILQQCREVTQGLDDPSDHMWTPVSIRRYKRTEVQDPLPTDVDWSALACFFAAPWFTRVWVLQEALLSATATIYYGAENIAFQDVILIAEWMQHRTYWRYMSGKQRASTGGIDNASVMYQRYKRGTEMNMLAVSRCFASSEPRDKVYGLLGLFDNALKITDGPPDYHLPLSAVYARATKALCKERQHLMLVIEANTLDPPASIPDRDMAAHDMAAWPSWVPRYDWEFRRELRSTRVIQTGSSRRADNFILPVFKDDEDLYSLSIQGIIIDEVHALSRPLSQSLTHDLHELQQELRLICDLALTANLASDVIMGALAHTLTNGPDYDFGTNQATRSLELGLECLLVSLALARGEAAWDLSTDELLQQAAQY